MSYIGSTPTTQSFIAGTDYFNGNGSTTAFTLSRPVVSVNDIQAVVNNVVQVPNDAYNVSGSTITFTSAPSSGTGNVYVRYMSTTTQSITPSQNTVSYSTWDNDLRGETFAFKNRLINGDMAIDQRNSGASVTPADLAYTLDRWQSRQNVASKYSVQQSSVAPSGFSNSMLVTSLSAYSVGSTDIFYVRQNIEGFNVADLGWGTASAQTITISFWVRSSLTGTFGGAVNNSAVNRSYPFSYTITAANTWEQKSITVTGDTTGTWVTNNGTGLRLVFGFGVGSTISGTAGAWVSGAFYAPTGATSVVGTNGATWYITGVQLEKGTTATNFDVLPYGTELALCQRYFQKAGLVGDGGLASGMSTATNKGMFSLYYKVTMRATPTFGYGNSLAMTDNVGYNATVSSVDAYFGNADSGRISLNGSSVMTQFRPATLVNSDVNGFYSLSAEL